MIPKPLYEKNILQIFFKFFLKKMQRMKLTLFSSMTPKVKDIGITSTDNYSEKKDQEFETQPWEHFSVMKISGGGVREKCMY